MGAGVVVVVLWWGGHGVIYISSVPDGVVVGESRSCWHQGHGFKSDRVYIMYIHSCS